MESTRSSLLRRVRDQADSASWDEFVGLYRPILIKYVGSRGLGAHDVDDVVQVIFEKLWQQLPNFELQRQRGRFRTWLWRVMHNAVVDWLRAQQRRVAAEETRRQELIARQSQFAEPHESWELDIRTRALQFAIEKVRPQAQPNSWACFEQHILKGRASSEVATELGMTENAVNVNCSRVLARVSNQCREYLEELGDEE